MSKEIRVPDIGDFDAVDVIEVLIKPGDSVAADQSIIVLESDKASMEVPADSGGTVEQVLVKVGDKVKQGDVIAVLAESATASAPAAKEADAPVTKEADTQVAAQAAAPAAQAGSEQDIVVPDIGDFDAVDVIEVNVKVGDTVTAEQGIITLESDKASMEVPAEVAGTIVALHVKVGDKVSKGSVIARLASSASVAALWVRVATVFVVSNNHMRFKLPDYLHYFSGSLISIC